jgi:hypothetical protein
MVVAESVANRNLEQRPRKARLQFRSLREVIRGLDAGLEDPRRIRSCTTPQEINPS